ncbi:esterase/lipase family protein [Actinosynnema sp. CA-248983]
MKFPWKRCALAAALLLAALLTPPAQAAAHDPILFVHGWHGNASNWNTMVNRFRADGWPDDHLRAFSYDTAKSNASTAEVVRAEVDRLLAATGAAKVDVITHSMGGLSSRHYARNLGGDLKIDQWVSLGGPNHGTRSANTCFQTSCTEMRIGSDFLAALNSGDETPGAPGYGTWWSACDGVIDPPDSTVLSGARNTRTACISHSALLTDAVVYGQVRDYVNR